jgi:hypothetical protein
LAGMMIASPTFKRYALPEILVSASPSNMWTSASNGAVCSLSS